MVTTWPDDRWSTEQAIDGAIDERMKKVVKGHGPNTETRGRSTNSRPIEQRYIYPASKRCRSDVVVGVLLVSTSNTELEPVAIADPAEQYFAKTRRRLGETVKNYSKLKQANDNTSFSGFFTCTDSLSSIGPRRTSLVFTCRRPR